MTNPDEFFDPIETLNWLSMAVLHSAPTISCSTLLYEDVPAIHGGNHTVRPIAALNVNLPVIVLRLQQRGSRRHSCGLRCANHCVVFPLSGMGQSFMSQAASLAIASYSTNMLSTTSSVHILKMEASRELQGLSARP